MTTAPIIATRERSPQVPFLTTEQLMEQLSVTRPCLLQWRNEGMPYVPLGGRAVRYNLDNVLEWLEARDRAYKAKRPSRGVQTKGG